MVGAVTSKETFVTAYTPYQAEMSQGVLQSIFEYQTMICELTGMDVSNASVYDGATAAAEAVNMLVDGKRRVALVSEGVHPMTLETVRTYAFGADVEIRTIPLKDGRTDMEALSSMLNKDVACVLFAVAQLFWPRRGRGNRRKDRPRKPFQVHLERQPHRLRALQNAR